MPRSRRCRKAGWWPGQHNCRPARRPFGKFQSFSGILTALALLTSQFSVQAQSLLHIRVLEGEGAIHAAGAKSNRGIVVEVTDETGKPVDAAAVSFRLPEEGPGGTFPRGMRTEIAITTPDGRAAVREIITARTPGPFQIRVTAVKESVRAGTVVDQYISDGPVKSQGKSATSGKGSHKWLLVAGIAGGAAAAGLVVGMRKGQTPPSTAGAAPSSSAPITIGAPTITIGKP